MQWQGGAPSAEQLEEFLMQVARRALEHGPGAARAWDRPSPEPELDPSNARRAMDAGACRLGVCGCPMPDLSSMAGYVDHTLLKPDATLADVDQLCAEALEHGFASVCVNGCYVRRCAEILAGSSVLVCSVIGFPLGAMASEVKVYEARRAIEGGACEIDMVINVGALKSRALDVVEQDIAGVAEVCHSSGARLKVIIETALLSDPEKVTACQIAKRAGADFVKTSTGFSKGGATVEDVALMRRTVGPALGVKASGGVRDQAGAEALIAAGATRIGASASIAIVGG